MAAIREVESRIESLRAAMLRSVPWQPFNGKYINALADFLARQTREVGQRWEQFHSSGDATAFINWLIDYARGNLKVAWYLRPFAGPALEQVRKWLHANKELLRAKVGEVA